MKYIKHCILLAIVTTIVLVACKKNVLTVSPFEYTNGKALLKVVYACPYARNPGVIIKINGEKVSSVITYSTPYPGGGLNTGGNSFADYLSVKPGENTVSLSIPYVGTGNDSILLHQGVYNFVANQFQSLHLTDTLTSTQAVQIIDPANRPDSGLVLFRFVNLIPNSGGIDLYFGPTKVASNVMYKASTDTFSIAAGTSLAWSLRNAGETGTLGTTYTSASTVANQRVFTVYARGYTGLPVADIRSPKISFAYNK